MIPSLADIDWHSFLARPPLPSPRSQTLAALARQPILITGAGGSIGFADPACGLSFGYTMNRMGAGLFLNDRGQSLVDAAYRALGYRSSASGATSS